jgi:hypothetical protein
MYDQHVLTISMIVADGHRHDECSSIEEKRSAGKGLLTSALDVQAGLAKPFDLDVLVSAVERLLRTEPAI